MFDHLSIFVVRAVFLGLFLIGVGLSGPWSFVSRTVSLRAAFWVSLALVAMRLVRRKRFAGLLIPLALAAAVHWTKDPTSLISVLAVMAWGNVLTAPASQRGGDTTVAVAVSWLWLFLLVNFSFPTTVLSAEAAIKEVVQMAGWPGDRLPMPGLVASGLPLILASLAGAFFCLRRRLLAMGVVAALTLLAWGCAIHWSFSMANLPKELELAVRRCALFAAVVAVAATCLPPLFVAFRSGRQSQSSVDPEPSKSTPWRVAAVCVGSIALGAFGSMGLWPSPASIPESGLRVSFYTEGGIDWKVPEYGRFGSFSSGMFGLLPHGLNRGGCTTSWITPEDDLEAALGSTDIFVVINCDEVWSGEREQIVESFVRRGGGLLALGDHTDVFGLMDGMNSLLDRYGMSYEFDSAYTLSGRSLSSKMQSRLGAVAWRRPTDPGPSISVGASLRLRKPARLLTWSHWAFRDIGSRANVPGSFLGNYSLGVKEEVGMIPLVASAEHGKGVVVAFGDTTAFQNASMSRSLDNDVLPLMAWMAQGADPEGSLPPNFVWVIGAWALLVFLATLGQGVEWVLLGLALGIAVPRYLIQHELAEGFPKHGSDGTEAVLARGYFQKFGHHDTDGSNLGPLVTALRRSGFWPSYVEDYSSWEKIQRAQVLTLIGPRQELPAEDADNLFRAMDEGALLIVAASGPDASGCAPLLARLGVRITRNFLPRTRASGEVQFMRPYEIEVDHRVNHERLVEIGSAAVVVFVPHGEGGALVFGDTSFFSTRNLEGTSGHHEGSQALVSSLLARLGGGEEGRIGQLQD